MWNVAEDMAYKIINGDCTEELKSKKIGEIDLSFLDPPFNQGKDYAEHDDNLPDEKYWGWMREVCSSIYALTSPGGAIYFMQREKNAEKVLATLRETGWTFQNLIIWKKKTSAIPSDFRFSKQHQIIVFATKGEKPRVFNKLRIDPPIPPNYKYERTNGICLPDVWDDIRELTSGYFAGDEALRKTNGDRAHTQQSPVALLLRIILASTIPGDTVLDPFAGSGTTLVVANQLERESVGIELDPENIKIIESRLKRLRSSDDVLQHYEYYRYSPNLKTIWPCGNLVITEQRRLVDARVC